MAGEYPPHTFGMAPIRQKSAVRPGHPLLFLPMIYFPPVFTYISSMLFVHVLVKGFFMSSFEFTLCTLKVIFSPRFLLINLFFCNILQLPSFKSCWQSYLGSSQSQWDGPKDISFLLCNIFGSSNYTSWRYLFVDDHYHWKLFCKFLYLGPKHHSSI